MAPQRRAEVVVKSTRKIERETVPLEDKAEEKEERVITEIPIEDEPTKEQPRKVRVPVEGPGQNRVQQQEQKEPKNKEDGKKRKRNSMAMKGTRRTFSGYSNRSVLGWQFRRKPCR
ncbi:hypothetical protein V6N13_000843 [Hibiscus sabdariffa]|uniref:Uncharacterized protein n=1 Tax=Hibiscus sabdariffa TaxID=183260 RepID=A0ABR2G6Q1_9ROSI